VTEVEAGAKTMKKSQGKILMLVQNLYPEDIRVHNEASVLVAAGYEISVISLRRRGDKFFVVIDGVRVYRVPKLEWFRKTAQGKTAGLSGVLLKLKSFLGYLLEYGYFTGACFLLSFMVLIKDGFDVIHAHNPPDTLFLSALPFKLFFGKKFIFDHHDLSPELYMSRYSAAPGIPTRLLTAAEWCSLRLADIAIATNESYKKIQIQRGGKKPESIFVVRNGPNKSRMTPRSPSLKLREMKKCILCYVGCLNPQDGVDYLLRSLHYLQHTFKRNDFHCVIMGTGDSLEDLRKLAGDLHLDGAVNLTGYVSDEELEANLAAADICLDPDPSSPLNGVSTWIKIMEYMAYSKPIVSFDLQETRFSAQEAALFVPANDERAFAKAIMVLMDDPSLRKRKGDAGRKRVEEQLQWSVVSENLLFAYKSLLKV